MTHTLTNYFRRRHRQNASEEDTMAQRKRLIEIRDEINSRAWIAELVVHEEGLRSRRSAISGALGFPPTALRPEVMHQVELAFEKLLKSRAQ